MEKIKDDLGLVVATKEEAYWSSVKGLTELETKDTKKQIKSLKQQLNDLEKALKLQNAILAMAEEKIAKEKDLNNSIAG